MTKIKYILSWTIFIIAFFFFVGHLFAYHPKLRWRTTETDHFLIHYHQGEEEIVKKCADLAEEIFQQITKDLSHIPSGRIQVVLLDDYDIANGSASPIPYNQVVIFLPSPEAGSELGSYDDWLRLVLTHELTHIVHLDMAFGLPRLNRVLFGRTPMGFIPILPTAFPNFSQPMWLIEGYSTFLETERTNGGRGRSSYFDMMLRCAVLEDRIPSLGQLTAWQTSWPDGTIAYLYGVSIYQYIDKKIGSDRAQRIAHANASALYPQFHIDSAPQTFGYSYFQIYKDWKKYLKEYYKNQLNEIKKMPLTISQPLTNRGYNILNPTYSPDGRQIAYIEMTPHKFPSLKVMDSDGKNDRTIAEGWMNEGLSWSPDGSQLVFSQLDFYQTYSIKSDLYNYEFKTKQVKRLSKGERSQDPVWSPDGKKLIYIRHRTGTQDLIIYSLDTGKKEILLKGEDGTQFSRPALSPDERQLAYSRWYKGGFQEICIFDLVKKQEQRITQDRAIDLAPNWYPNGKWLYFSSDRTEIFNIYAYSIETEELSQVTNVVGGAFLPSVNPNGQTVAFSNYSSRGFDIHTISINQTQWKLAEFYKERTVPIQYSAKKTTIHSDRNYNPLPTLMPHYWMPNFQGGITISGFDALMEHGFNTNTYYGSNFDVSYSNQQFYPSFLVNLWDKQSMPEIANEGYSLTSFFPFKKIRYVHGVFMGYAQKQYNVNRLREERMLIPRNFIADRSGVNMGWLFSDAEEYGFSVSPEKGRTLSVNYYFQGRETGADERMKILQGRWVEYFPMIFSHHVLSIGCGGGVSNESVFDSADLMPMNNLLVHKEMGLLRMQNESLKKLGRPSVNWPGKRSLWALPPLARDDVGFYKSEYFYDASYSYPIWYVENALGTGFYFLDRIWGQFFFFGDHLKMSDYIQRADRFHIGAELSTDWGISYFLPVSIGINIQRETSAQDDWKLNVHFDVNIEF